MKDSNYLREEVIQKLHNGWIIVEGQSQVLREFRQIIQPVKTGENRFRVYHYGKSLKPVYLAKKTPVVTEFLKKSNTLIGEGDRLLKVTITRGRDQLLFEAVEFSETNLE